MRVKTAPRTFDVFTKVEGNWKYLYTIEAGNMAEAKEKAMREHKLFYGNTVAVYPKK